jgi:AraC family transcriptional regulator
MMESRVRSPIAVVNEIRVPAATVQLVNYPARGAASQIMHPREEYWLDFTLTPRPKNARANYVNHWQPNRFEGLGKLFMLPQGEILNTRGDGSPEQTSLVCQLNADALHNWLDEDHLVDDQHLSACLNIADDTLGFLLSRLANEVKNPSFGSEALIEHATVMLIIELGRYYKTKRVLTETVARGLNQRQLSLINERIQEVKAPPSLEELASLCQLSVRHITRAYRQATGSTIGEKIARARMENAINLLRTDMRIKVIALTLGFNSSASFCCAFRKATQYTPGQYRARYLSH